MNIKPKNYNIIYAAEGVKFTPANANGANWRQLVFEHYRLHLLDQLASYGELDDYGYWLNDMLGRHAKLYKAANESGDWQKTAYADENVGKYQHDYHGTGRFGTYKPNDDYKTDFNLLGIINAQNAGRYDVSGPTRTSGDYGNHNFKVDNLYSAITDDRRLLGRKGDWDENSEDYKKWQSDLNARGWEMYLDNNDNYYKLRRFVNDPEQLGENPAQSNGNIPVRTGLIPAIHTDSKKIDWNNLFGKLKLNLPGLLEAGRLAGSLISNDRMFNAKLKAIRPNLLQTYLTHRQVVGDEGTKQAYYRKAAAGETRAAQPFTSDADRQVAYRMEAKRIGDELRAQGDLADNAEIRRTSDESNQHLWANTQRRTETANYNTTALNAANADKQNLIANKYAADYTSWDNFLKGVEYRARENQERTKAIQEQIWALDQQNRLENDEEYTKLYENYYNTMKKVEDKYKDSTTGIINRTAMRNDPDVKKAYAALQLKLYELKRQLLIDMQNYLLNNSLFGKNGIKITYKNKNDLLYKTSRDAVEHFRKMVKLTDDSTIRSRMKPIKLSPHPGGRTRRMQLGGVAPFTVFTPVVLGGERSSTSTASTGQAGSSSKSAKSDGDTPLDIIKSLFKELQGLPSDVNSLYASMANFLSELSMLGGQLSTDDLSAMYLQQLLQINRVKFSKDAYDKAKEKATQNDALQEFAVDTSGRLVVQNKDTAELSFATWDEVKKANGVLNPLTNDQLLSLRAYNQDLKFNDNILNIVNNGIGMSKIADFIKNHKPTLGSTEQTIPGFTKHETNLIKQGFELLLEAPAGDYSFEKYTKEQRKQAEYALKYIYSILPNNMKSVLNVHADILGTSVENMLTSLINSELTTITKVTFNAMTGKGAKNADGSNKDDVGDMSPSMAFFMGMGDRNTFVIQDKTQDGLKISTNSMSLIDSQGHNLGASTLLGVTQSMYGSLLDKKSITMGGVKISPNGQNNVLIGDGTIYSTELPIDKEAASQGIIKPDLTFLKNIEKADLQLREMGIVNRDNLTQDQINTINKVYKDNNLPIIYSTDGSGKPILTSDYRRFALLNAYATEDAFEGDMTFNDGVLEIDDEKELNQFEGMMKTVTNNDKYKLDRGWFSGTNLYKGVIYIPMVSSTITALGGTGYKGTAEEYMRIDDLQKQRDNAIRLGYKTPVGNASILK